MMWKFGTCLGLLFEMIKKSEWLKDHSCQVLKWEHHYHRIYLLFPHTAYFGMSDANAVDVKPDKWIVLLVRLC